MNAAFAALRLWPAGARALAWPGGAMSYGDLRARSGALARVAAGLGAPGSPLVIASGTRLNTVLGLLAALRLGRPALALDPARRDVAACLAACRPGGVLADEGIELPESLPRADFAGRRTAPARIASIALPAGAASDIALLVPTSGTAGTTRIAMLTARAMDAHVAASGRVLPPIGPGDRWLVCLPMTTIGGIAALWRTLTAGACLGFLESFDADAARLLMGEGATHVSVVPAMLAPLAACRASPPPRGLRCLLSGGGALPGQAAAAALEEGWPLWSGWGMTESASHVAVGPVDGAWREGIVGRPLPGVALDVAAARGQLSVAGPMLMSGYARPGLVPGVGLETDGRFVTSDLGERLPDGRLCVLGRADDVIVTGGVNVHPQGVEAVLAACAGAGDVAVTGRPDERWGMALVALYTGSATAAALAACARERLASAACPREFLRVRRLPRNAMGKLLRAELPGLYAAACGREQDTPPPPPA
jgi:o-succinylbenzoate---CoA ligase